MASQSVANALFRLKPQPIGSAEINKMLTIRRITGLYPLERGDLFAGTRVALNIVFTANIPQANAGW